MEGGAWWAAVHGVAESQTQLSDFTFTFHFHALEKEMATHSSVLAWRIPGTGKPSELPSMGSHRVRHDWSDLAATATAARTEYHRKFIFSQFLRLAVQDRGARKVDFWWGFFHCSADDCSLACPHMAFSLCMPGKTERSLVFLPLLPLLSIRLVTLMSSIISLKVLFSIQLSWVSELQHTNFGETIQSMTLAQHFIQIYHFKPTGIYYLTVLFRQKSRLIFMFYVSQRWNHSFDLSCYWEVYSSLFGLLAESSSMRLKFPVSLLAVICGLAQMVKKLPAMKKTWVQSLGGEDLLEKGVAVLSSVLAWRIFSWIEEPGGLQSMGLQRVRRD